MAERQHIPLQVSLRALLLALSATGVLFWTWGALGPGWFFLLGFAIVSACPLFVLSGPWKRAYALAWGAVYGPFLVMALYTLWFVPCDHCKATTWKMLPFAPGLPPLGLARAMLNLPQAGDALSFALATNMPVALVAGLSWLVHRRRWIWSAAGMALAILYGAGTAFVLLSMIRM